MSVLVVWLGGGSLHFVVPLYFHFGGVGVKVSMFRLVSAGGGR